MGKGKKIVPQSELVAFLEGVLAEIREGKLTVEGKTLNLPDAAAVELETEEKDETTKVELEIEWRVKSRTSGVENPKDAELNGKGQTGGLNPAENP